MVNAFPPENTPTDDDALAPVDELERLLFEDQTRLGDVYRLHVIDGLLPSAVADALDIDTPGFVYTYRAHINAILHGDISNSVHLRKQTASRIRSLIKQNRAALSSEALRLLNEHRALAEQALDLEDEVDEIVADRAQDAETIAATTTLENTRGIYAFSYGWYLEHPVDDRSNTLIKVGRSERVGVRISEHQRGARAHIPEPLVVLRVYSVPDEHDLEQTERDFHRLLSTAGHENPRRLIARRNEVGKEWFLTNEDFLDAVASALKLRTAYTGQSAFITQ